MIPRKLMQLWSYSTRGIVNPPLLSLVLELTNKCNLRCKICHARNSGEEGFMNLSLVKRLLDEAGGYLYPLRVGLSFRGEPLLHPQIDTILEHARTKKNLRLSLNTNGLLLHKHDLRGVHVTLSDHSRDSERWNEPEDLSQVDTVAIVSPYPQLRNRVQYWLDRGKTVTVTPYGENLQPSVLSGNYLQPYCFWVFEATHIFYNGDVCLCCHDMEGKTVGENIGDRTLKELWRSGYYEHLRKSALELKTPLIDCDNCEYWRFRNFSKVYHP